MFCRYSSNSSKLCFLLISFSWVVISLTSFLDCCLQSRRYLTTFLLKLSTQVRLLTTIDIGGQDLEIRPCIGCLKCRPDKPCVLPKDDANILAEKIKEADLLIIGSPVYWGNMPGTLKLFFDRNVPLFEYCEANAIKYLPRPQLKGKKAILIV